MAEIIRPPGWKQPEPAVESSREPNPKAIEMLEALLGQARSGELRGFLIFAEDANGPITLWSDVEAMNPAELVLALETEKLRQVQMLIAAQNDETD